MEFLKEHIEEELYNKLAEKLKGNEKVKLGNLATGEYVGKDKFVALEATNKQLDQQIKDRDKQLDDLKKVDAAGLQAEITRLQSENTQAKTDFDNQLKRTQLDYKLETLLLKEGAVNTKAVKALLDAEKISLDGENLIGVDDQLKTLKEKEKWAFKEQTTEVPGGGANPPLTSPPKTEDKNKLVVDRVSDKMSMLFKE